MLKLTGIGTTQLEPKCRCKERGIAPDINHEDVFGNLDDGALGGRQFGHVASMELHAGQPVAQTRMPFQRLAL